MFLADKLQRSIDALAWTDDPQERLGVIVDRAKKIAPLPANDRVDANRVPGCVSIVWLVGAMRDGRCYFRGDADSPVVRGLLVFLAEFFSGVPAEEVAESNLDPLEALGLTRNLSPTRRNGLASARETIRAFARQSVSTKR